MTVDITHLDPHEQPSEELRAKWKAFARTEPKDLRSSDIDDLHDPASAAEFVTAGTIPLATLNRAFGHICPSDAPEYHASSDAAIYYHPLLPGLLVLPSLLPPAVQRSLLDRLVHRDLSNPVHQTNLHLHYDLPYPQPPPPSGQPPAAVAADPSDHGRDPALPASFFTYPPTSPVLFSPKDPAVHKPLTIKQVLDRKLHWVTLGGQYDWTKRQYPSADGEEEGEGSHRPPPFPPDVAAFIQDLFPETVAQAAIVNFYSPGDTMMMHRDVSERTDKGLVSISLGCDGLFMIAPPTPTGNGKDVTDRHGRKKEYLLLRLRSGDAIYMTRESRIAFHGVPKVLKATCPEYLENWPAGEEGGRYEEWRGWMKTKRVNLNVRQMWD
ncbi:hypothetical protein VTJ83DRAFT_7137 [Remersonia thermophila]|uniref:Fe2OG dioxygenase domain-containing protein n=1 Tax=Remersonia thermophila TaxID=72144 RepID=A0ABR4D2U6_9PEZI